MGMFFPDDDTYNNGLRQTGFNRYKQLLSERSGGWLKMNLITCIGAAPLVFLISVSVAATSVLLLIPLSFIGGMIFGPFMSCLFDSILRGLRDDPDSWWEEYKRGWRQNWRTSLIPGGFFGLLAGFYTFMGFMMYWRTAPLSRSVIVMYFLSAFVVLSVHTVLWSLLVLFDQTPKNRIINIVSYIGGHLRKVVRSTLFQLIFIVLAVLFAPWSLFLIPFLGWYVRFVTLFIIYDSFDEFFSIEEQINAGNRNAE